MTSGISTGTGISTIRLAPECGIYPARLERCEGRAQTKFLLFWIASELIAARKALTEPTRPRVGLLSLHALGGSGVAAGRRGVPLPRLLFRI